MKLERNVLILLVGALVTSPLAAQQDAPGRESSSSSTAKSPGASPANPFTGKKKPSAEGRRIPPGLRRLAKDYDIWLDLKRRMLVVDGEICLREGQLEMFICPKGTKEHESVIALNCKSSFVHAGLMALGAKPGHPVRFRPKYSAASGTVIDILVLWKNRQGEPQLARGQDFVKNMRSGKLLRHDWVFGGSSFWVDEDTGDRIYHGDGGELVCVSNFPTATLDLPIESSQANTDLLYAAHTARIPTLGTKVRVLFIPRLPKKDKK